MRDSHTVLPTGSVSPIQPPLSAQALRRGVLKGALASTLGLVGAGMLSAANPRQARAASAATAGTFPIQVKASGLVYQQLMIPGQTDPFDTRTVQTLNLAPGRYGVQLGSSFFADFTFTVTSRGSIDYDPGFETFLHGRGSSTLVLNGFDVTLDARYLSGSGVLLVLPYTTPNWISYARHGRMLPASGYQVLVGSAHEASFNFTLGTDGRFTYAAAYDVASGGFLAGAGTTTLQFLGYPLLVDARLGGGSGLAIEGISGMPVTPTQVQFANLLPAPYYGLQVASAMSGNQFAVAADGTITLSPALAPAVQMDTFHGLRRMRVIGPLSLTP